MPHGIYRVTGFEKISSYTLRVAFDDGTNQLIDFEPVLRGELFGPLRDPSVFDDVKLDPEVHTLVWPNGADFDPAILHDWPTAGRELQALAEKWTVTASEASRITAI
jgi:hypothetical protein